MYWERGGGAFVLEESYLVLLKAQRSLKENALSGRFGYERPLDLSSQNGLSPSSLRRRTGEDGCGVSQGQDPR